MMFCGQEMLSMEYQLYISFSTAVREEEDGATSRWAQIVSQELYETDPFQYSLEYKTLLTVSGDQRAPKGASRESRSPSTTKTQL